MKKEKILIIKEKLKESKKVLNKGGNYFEIVIGDREIDLMLEYSNYLNNYRLIIFIEEDGFTKIKRYNKYRNALRLLKELKI